MKTTFTCDIVKCDVITVRPAGDPFGPHVELCTTNVVEGEPRSNYVFLLPADIEVLCESLKEFSKLAQTQSEES